MKIKKNKILALLSFNKAEEFRYKLRNYSFLSFLSRVIFNSFLALVIIHVIRTYSGIDSDKKIEFSDYLTAFFSLFILNEILVLVDSLFEKFLPIPIKIKRRLFFQSVIILLIVVLVFFITTNFLTDNYSLPKPIKYVSLAVALTIGALFSSSLLLTRMVFKWIQFQRQYDEMKKENLKMDYTALQDQLNPHFLFNNLSVLKSLIMFDKKTALKFTDDFSDVYRYVLKSKNERLVELDAELAFIESYIGLHKERLGEGLNTEFMIDDSERKKQIAPLTMQLLVENAIKHNIASKERPLKLKLTANNNCLTVENTLQLKSASYSTQTGLKNLQKRYTFLTKQKIVISENTNTYKVTVPLL